MTQAELEPYFGSNVVVTVAIASLEAAQYVGKLSPFSGNATPKHWVTPPRSAPSEPRVVLLPLAAMPSAYNGKATNGLALCPISAVTSITRI